ncbi:MAG: Resolvase protein [Candidatus Kaiserbacteria bacterium]|nr:Resolvase protein [Candidatus Kaiserbacteria bacterium]
MESSLKYFAYCRKSSEDSQRQIASIGDQVHALQTLAERECITLVNTPFTEVRSAKDPGRPIFNEMLRRIEKGEANALICWDIDRLSRNPIDNGQLQWMLQKSVIKVIKTPGRAYYPEDAGLLMSIEGGRATDYVMRLSKNVKRGLQSRVMHGWRPGITAPGYLLTGEQGNRTIIPDPERFDLIRSMFSLYLTGEYSGIKLLDIMNNQWGYRTMHKKKSGGRPLVFSNLYQILNNPFYYGYFEWKNSETSVRELHKGNHMPMITEAEFLRIQILLGNKSKHRGRVHESSYTGLIRCGECDSSVTVDIKNQLICTNCKNKFSYKNKTECPKCGKKINKMEEPKTLHYVYYHCTKKKNLKCTQGSILESELVRQIDIILGDITIDDDYLNLALEYLQEKRKHDGNDEKKIRDSLNAALADCQTRFKNLEREYTSAHNSNHEIFSPDEFLFKKNELSIERRNLEKRIIEIGDHFEQSLEETVRVVDFCHLARVKFMNGDTKTRRSIFSTIGSNLTLKDKKLMINKLHPYLLIENELQTQRKLHSTLEPTNDGFNERLAGTFPHRVPTWLGDLGSNQDSQLQRLLSYH